jgi:CDP-glycerol glycerophosphotransferase (TagB/SpsB family)
MTRLGTEQLLIPGTPIFDTLFYSAKKNKHMISARTPKIVLFPGKWGFGQKGRKTQVFE